MPSNGARTYSSVKSMLDNKLDRRPASSARQAPPRSTTPNIRGPRHEIATVQTTAIDKEAGLIRLTTTRRVAVVGMAGLPDQRDRGTTEDGRGAHPCKTIRALHPGRHRRRGRSRRA
jgi:hypothetical protein